MAVVRREGDWRLEKTNDGVYEITFKKDLEAKVITSEYDPGMFDERFDTIPVREVESFSEAKSVFEDYASEGGQPSMGGFGPIGGTGGTDIEYPSTADSSDGFENIEGLPPGAFAIVMLFGGGITISSFGFDLGSLPFLAGVGMLAIGVAIFGWTAFVFQTRGAGEAWSFLTTISTDESNRSSGDDDTDDDKPEKTPPAPQSLKDELYFGRANQQCEWCEDRVDHPEVHHIKPRNEGGPNTHSNLIVLCPDCHAKADSGGISRTKLQSKVRRLSDSSTA